MVMGPDSVAAIDAEARRVREALERWDAGREYLNFAEHRTDTSRLYDPTAYARLRAIKADVDPDGVFRGNHAIPAA
jgi:FAD/FMN-containing dehydrogenase